MGSPSNIEIRQIGPHFELLCFSTFLKNIYFQPLSEGWVASLEELFQPLSTPQEPTRDHDHDYGEGDDYSDDYDDDNDDDNDDDDYDDDDDRDDHDGDDDGNHWNSSSDTLPTLGFHLQCIQVGYIIYHQNQEK